MSDIYKLQYNNMTLTFPGWNGAVSYEAAPAFKTLTLCASQGGTLTATSITGYPGDTVTLSTAYNTYWRFSGYAKAGDGSISNNTYTFGEDDVQTVSAFYKKNAFTATGGFEKGSNVSCEQKGAGSKTANVPAKYAIHGSHTGNVPTAWYNSSNRWKPTNASAYTIRLMPKMLFKFQCDTTGDYGKATACSLIGSTATQTASYSRSSGTHTDTYSKNFTTTTQNVNYGISAKIYAEAHFFRLNWWASAYYIATGTTGTWSATGYAP